MSTSTNYRADAIERTDQDLAAQDAVWMGSPAAEEVTEPASVELFATREHAERYVESLDGADGEWVAWESHEGRRLVDATGEAAGVVGKLQATAPGPLPPLDGSPLERLVPAESRLRSLLPVSDRPDFDRERLPFAYFDLVLLSERGHLRLDVGDAPGEGAARYRDALADYAERTVSAATSTSDDRVARSRIEELHDYFQVEGATAYYGKPRYRLAKKLSDWGGETGRCATLELWLLFQLVLRLAPDHLAWEAGYAYHDDH